jgi:RNA polymerase sigma factor (sigma-70 family)
VAAQRVEQQVSLPPFQSLLDAHGHDVHRFLAGMVGPIDADDCYQETWISALRAYPRLHDASNLRAWLLTIAYRKGIDQIRVRRRGAVPVAELPEVLVGTGGGNAAGTSLELPDDGIWALVRRLPDKQRTALALRYIVDADYALISTAMATSEEAARRNVHEALKRLRMEYER